MENESAQFVTSSGRVIFDREAAGQQDLFFFQLVLDGVDAGLLANSPDSEIARARF